MNKKYASSALASILIVAVLIQIFFPNTFSQGATFHFQQGSWLTQTSNVAEHPGDQTTWTQYESADPGIATINGGEDVQLQQTSDSVAQTSDTDFAAGTNTDTRILGTGNDARVELSEDIHVNEYTVGHLADVPVTVTAVGASSPWLLTLSGAPNLSRTFKNDEFTDGVGKKWKVLSLNPSSTTPRLLVIDSEGNGGAPAIGVGHTGRWYADLAAWEAGRQGDLVSRNAVERALPYYDVGPDTTPLVIDGWTTDAMHYVEINVPLSERHRGRWDDGKYRIVISTNTAVITLQNSNVKIFGLQIDYDYNGSRSGIYSYSQSNFEIGNNIIKKSVAGVFSSSGFAVVDVNDIRFYNNIVYDFYRGVSIMSSVGASNYVYNNTVYNSSDTCYLAGNNTLYKNNLAQNCGIGYYSLFQSGSTNNLSNLADAPGINPQNSKTVAFVSLTNKDFHLRFDDTAAKNSGTDLSADANLPITTDIDGDTRSGTWDIGADDVGATYVHTNSIGTASRDFATLQAWEDARDGVLTTRNVFQIGSQTGAFTAGETITGSVSGATGTYIPERATPSSSETYMSLDVLSGTFQANETLTGATSGSTANLSFIITVSGVIEKGEAYNDSVFTASTTINGSTVDANHYMWLTVEPRSRQSGISGTGAKIEGDGTTLVSIINNYTVFEWFEIVINTLTTYSATAVGLPDYINNDYVKLQNLIVRRGNGSVNAAYRGISSDGYPVGTVIRNSFIYGFNQTGSAGGIDVAADGVANYMSIQNVTLFDNLTGVNLTAGTYTKVSNTVSAGTGSGGNFEVGTWNASSSNNLSSDGTAPGASSLTYKSLSDIKFVSTDASLIDLHIMPGSVAKNAGADLSSTFSKDIDGQTRPTGSGTWDVGADEWQSSSPIYKSSGTFESAVIDLGVKADLDTFAWNTSSQQRDTQAWVEVAANNDNNTWNYQKLNEYSYPAGVTVEEKSVRQDCTGYAAGTCYASLTAWQASYSNRDLVAQNKIAVAKIDGPWTVPDTAVSFSGWTTGPDNFVRVWVTPEARHNGRWSVDKYRMLPTTSAIYGTIGYLHVDGVQIDNRSAASAVNVGNGTNAGEFRFENSIVRGDGATAGQMGFLSAASSTSFVTKVNNCLFYNFEKTNTGTRLVFSNTPAPLFVNNVTTWGGYYSFYNNTNPNVTCNNCISNNSTAGFNGTFNDSNYNISDLAADAPGANSKNLTTVSFVDTAGGDFRLSSSDTAAKDSGTDLSGYASNPIGMDMEGFLRPSGAAWDIGAFEYGANKKNIPASLDGNRFVRYRAHFNTAEPLSTPVLSDAAFSYTSYPASASLVSSPYDTTDSANILAKLQWGETLNPNTDVTFQVRTSADGNTWTDWVGPDGTSATTFTDQTGGETTPALVSDGSGDRFVQYKAILSSDGTATPSLSSTDLTYVVNAPPELQNVTAVQNADGTVIANYEVRDPDTTTGIMNGQVQVSLEYCTANCTNVGGETWTAAATVSGNVGNVDVSETLWTDYAISWNAKADYPEQVSDIIKLRVVAYDGELANQYARVASNAIIDFDTKNPSGMAFAIDNRTKNLTIQQPSEDSDYQLYAATSLATLFDGANLTNLDQSSAYPATYNFSALGTDPATAYVGVKDVKGNTASLAMTTPQKPNNIVYYDVSNASSDDFREFIAWTVVDPSEVGSGFDSYQIERSLDGSSFSNLAQQADRNSNFHMDNNLTEGQHYWYKAYTKDTSGNFSAYSSTVDDVPDGQGGSDSTPPTITNVAVSEINTTHALVTWTTDELADSFVGFSTDTSYATEQGSSVMTTSHSVVLTGLDADTAYNIRVKSHDVIGNLGQNDAAVPGTNPPANFAFSTTDGPAITNVNVTEVNNNDVTIEWETDVASDSSVQYASLVSDGALVSPQTVGDANLVTDHSVKIAGLTPNQTYYFSISSRDGSDNLAEDDNSGLFFSFLTTQDSTAPEIATSEERLVSDTSAVIYFLTDEPANATVEYGTSESDLDLSASVSTFDFSHFVALTSLSADTEYFYRIKTSDINGNERISTTENFSTLKNYEFDHKPLDAITDIKEAVITDTEAVISFATRDEDDVLLGANCLLEYGTQAGNYNGVPQSETSGVFSKSHSLHLAGLVFSTQYFYKITCQDNLETIVSSDEKTFTTKEQLMTGDEWGTSQGGGDIVPPTISNVSVKDVSGESVTITWDTDENASSSARYGMDTNYGSMAGDDTVNIDKDKYSKTHSVVLSNLIPGTKYYFTVLSSDVYGNIGESSQDTFSTGAVSSLSSIEVVSPEIGQATVSWKSSAETTSIVEYGTSESYGEKKESNTYAKSHELSLSGLNTGVKYHFRVKGKDKDGKYYASSDQTFEPKSPPKIEGVNINEVDEHGLKITFKTNVPTDASIIYMDVANKDNSGSQGTPEFGTQHEVSLQGLMPGTTYSTKIMVRDEQGSQSDISGPDFTTGKDENPPKIDQIRTDAALTQNEKVQTIIHWKTDELATSAIIYHEGRNGEPKELKITDNLTNSHVAVITVFKPGTAYYFNVKSVDAAGNEAVSGDFALLTPKKNQNIIEIIINNFQDIFGWVKR